MTQPDEHASKARPARFRLLWAASKRFPSPQLLGAFSDGLVEAIPEEFEDRCEEAIRWFLDFGDEPREAWTFWTTWEEVAEPSVPVESDSVFMERAS